MASRNWSFLPAAAALVAAACGGPGRDDPQRIDSMAPSDAVAQSSVPSPVSSVPAVHDSAFGQAASPVRTTAQPRNATASPRRVMIGDVDLTGVGYDVGERTAPVVVVDFSDFGCPFCGQFARESYPTLEREYVRTGKVFYKHVPFVAGFPNGQHAARAAECAADQGKFWPMHDSLYAHQGEWRKSREHASVFQRDAVALGLDRARFDECYASQEVHPRTRRASEIADNVGVRVTPSFVVNGRPVEGALPVADFRRVIEAALLVEKARP